IVVSSTGTGNTINQPTTATNASGQTTATMSSTVVQTKTISVTISGIAITNTASVVFEPGPVSADQSTVEATTPVAASVDPSGPKSTITITAKDAYGNVLPDIAPGDVVVSSTGTGNTITQPTVATNASGQTTATMSSTVVETKTISVTIGGTAITDTATVIFTGEPALIIEKSDDADPVNPNTDITYTITYGNVGLGNASNTVIVETLPANLIYVSSSGDSVHEETTRTITWTVDTPLNAETTGQTVTFTARVANSGTILDGGIITNSELTIDCDETDPAGQIASETTTVNDKKAPETSGHVPDPNSFQIPTDTVVELHITDGGSGVEYDGGTVTIQIEGDLIYDGANETSPGVYDSNSISPGQAVKGVCTRSGSDADYTFVFVPSTPFDYEQRVDVVVNATDKAGNVMPEESYDFYTAMRSFAPDAKVNSDTGTLDQDNPATITDSGGNIWIVWDQTNAAGNTDVYVGILPADANAFEVSVPVANTAYTERNPAIAVDVNDVAYVVWEADYPNDPNDPNNHWDVFVSSSSNGTSWSAPVKVDLDDPNNTSDQMSPVIAINQAGPDTLYVACQDNRAGNYDIWLATSPAGTTWTPTQITTDPTDQTEPALATDASGTAYLIWTDARNGDTDIYGADSTTGPWTEVAVVDGSSNNQWAPAIAAESSGTVLHLLWIDDADPNGSIFHAATTDGLQGPLVLDPDVVDDRDRPQSAPVIAVRGTGSAVKVFTCWQDGRYANLGDAADIFFAETASSFGTDILINDESGMLNTQTKPDIGIDPNGNPYIVWVDDRNGNNDIFYAGATAINILPPPDPVPGPNEVKLIWPSVGIEITIPTGALPERVDANNITIAKVVNPPAPPSGGFGLPYDFGPSSLQFNQPVTITIPHAAANCPGYSTYVVYWYNLETATWSQDGITNVQHNDTSDPHTVSFQTTHFTIFAGGGSTTIPVTPSGGSYHGGSGGGCSLSPNRQGNVVEFLLPYIAYVIVLLAISRVDARRRRAKSSG
ncbi:MAG: DUF11 domain-containing protein, partial [Phycisphaerae bacterium]|nr:DUF11 domain-containing protein [Phycisphaerae bacterium]